MPIRGVDHIDLAVSDVDRSLAFYLGMLGPMGDLRWRVGFGATAGAGDRLPRLRSRTCSGYSAETHLGLRKADGGEHRYYEVGIEHLAFTLDARSEVDDAYQRCLSMDARIHYPPEEELPGYYTFFVFDLDGIRIELNHWSAQMRKQWDEGVHLEIEP